jgi:hypothetical protein
MIDYASILLSAKNIMVEKYHQRQVIAGFGNSGLITRRRKPRDLFLFAFIKIHFDKINFCTIIKIDFNNSRLVLSL